MAESRWAERPAGFWNAVEIEYRGGTKLTEIYAHFELTKGEFDTRRDAGGWPRRNYAPVDQQRLIRRLFWLVNKHVIQMERNMVAGGDKDIAVLNQLVGTVGKLIRFELVTTPIGKRQNRTKSLAGIREKLVARIEELKRG